MRLSKIFGKNPKEDQPEQNPEEKIDLKKIEKVEDLEKIIFSKEPQKEHIETPDSGDIRKNLSLYEEGVFYIKEIQKNIQNKSFDKEIPCLEYIEKLIDEVLKNNQRLLLMTEKSTMSNYLYSHLINACILSLFLGNKMKLSREDLKIIGIASLFYDISLFEIQDLINKKGKLSSLEFNEIKKHPERSAEILKSMGFSGNLNSEVFVCILQHHERIDKSGYPKGLKASEINQKAQIIQIVDTYEAMTHPRAYRTAHLPHNVLKHFIESSQKEFDLNVIKSIVELFSLYPLGSIIKLNTEEIGRVIKINYSFPTRPVIEIYLDKQNEVLSRPRVIDLSKLPMLHIKEPVSLPDLQLPQNKLKLILNLKKIWI